jgi:LytS/YehU family sensor histidine kinase
MHQNDVKHAGDYLVKFSQLIRYVLETSSSRMVPLSDDLEALKIYMELEQLRMQQSFTFSITVDDAIRQDDVCIPAMMMQPFVENSIWHGLVNKAEGVISIHLKKQGNIIECLIDDNGQRNVGTGNKSITIKKTSMGMSLIKERLEVVRQIFNVNADFEMLDLKSGDGTRAGTRISLRLPFEE